MMPSTSNPQRGILRSRKRLLLGAVFLAGVAAPYAVGPAGSWMGRHLGVAAAFAQDSDRADTYRLLTLFGDVFERVRGEYVEPVNDRDLIENAINGMLTGLDPHSNYMNARAFRDMQVQTRGEFGGLGIEVTQDNGYIKVISPIDDTPASRAGVKAGDLIVALDGKTVQGLTLNEAVDRMRGPPNSRIALTIRREGGAAQAQAGVGRQAEGDRARPAQQPGRPARPGGRGERRLPVAGRDRVHARAPP